MEVPGIRKGAWTEEEDAILRMCIEKYGEGNWYQVPRRAGLNRCRKSCRLRWLNYLKPNINRGAFQEDEIDLMLRLHKLLGNRWSLIASRLPGRTANDVKNYWNTHIKKKYVASVSDEKHKAHSMAKIEVIKPHPRTFKNFSSITSREATMEFFSSDLSILNSGNFNSTPIISHQPQLVENNETNWWEGLLSDNHAIVEVGATNGANITTSVVAEETSEAVAIDPLCSLDVVANESWHGSDWSVDVLYDMTFNFQEILQENDELIAQ